MSKFLRYTVPSVMGCLVTSLYLVVDGVFIARGVGEAAVAAVTLVLPLTMAFVALSMIFSIGGGNLVSISRGAGDEHRAVNVFRESVCMLLLMGVLFSVLGTLFADEIAISLGATGELIPFAAEYTRYYMLFTVPVLLAIALSTFIRHDGSPKLSMRSMLYGAITNIVLDYVFVFPLQMGLRGAAIASGLGQIVTVVTCMKHFAQRRGILRIGKASFKREDITEIFALGFPSFLTEVSYSVMMYLHNLVVIRQVGEIGVTAYGIVNYINNLSYMALFGIGQGIQPMVSYYYGRGKFSKAREQYRYGIKASLVMSALFFVICLFAGRPLIMIFASSEDVIDLSYTILTYLNLAYILLGVNLTTQMYMQSMHMPRYANIICFLRGFVFVKIGLALLPHAFGDAGIWATLMFTEGMSLLVALVLARPRTKPERYPSPTRENHADQISRS
ncbi:MAG: MATE family efflux transporter [Firmicutes bacterium]|nr:MATE family efflux transporter [Bacillota bacterium]MDD4337321.1 MATE family efflux transporter [Bacillota bacterium]